MKGLQGQWSVRNSRNPECLHSPNFSSIACLEHPRDMYSNLGNSVLSNLKGVGSKMIVFIEHSMDTNMVSTWSCSVSYTSFISLVEDYFSFLYQIEPNQEVIIVLLFLPFIYRQKQCSSLYFSCLMCKRETSCKIMYSLYSSCTLLNLPVLSLSCMWGKPPAEQCNPGRLFSRISGPASWPSLCFLGRETSGQKMHFFSFSVLNFLTVHRGTFCWMARMYLLSSASLDRTCGSVSLLGWKGRTKSSGLLAVALNSS